MISFKRNPKTGVLEVYKDGKKSGKIVTMGDKVKGEPENGNAQHREH